MTDKEQITFWKIKVKKLFLETVLNCRTVYLFGKKKNY